MQNKKTIISCIITIIILVIIVGIMEFRIQGKNDAIDFFAAQVLTERSIASSAVEENNELRRKIEEAKTTAEPSTTVPASTTQITTEKRTKVETTVKKTTKTTTVATTQKVSKPQNNSIRENLARSLYCEARGMNWKGQVYTCSATLNLSDHLGKNVIDLVHDSRYFSTASQIDSVTPSSMQYEVVDYVLNGGRIPEICYFRTGHYHNFGTPVCEVDGHYFSKP